MPRIPYHFEKAETSGPAPLLKNSQTAMVGSDLYLFGGYDGRDNSNTMYFLNCNTFKWSKPVVKGTPPLPRNGHTMTYAQGQLVIIGGWLGSGPYAAKDLFTYSIVRSEWKEPETSGVSPGPCNMHTADWIESKKAIFVFRGGDGVDYDNSVFSFKVNALKWEEVSTAGTKPGVRANHASCVDGDMLYIFGGSDGEVRDNSLYMLNTAMSPPQWSSPVDNGELPMARAGATLTNVRGMLVLFGGSESKRTLNDLWIYNPKSEEWVECKEKESGSQQSSILDSEERPEVRSGHTATLHGKSILIIGGSDAKGVGGYYNNCYKLQVGEASTGCLSSLFSCF